MAKNTKAVVVRDGQEKQGGDGFLTQFIHALRLDGWTNILTGFGRKDRDARTHAQVKWEPRAEVDLENMMAADAMAAKIVEIPVDEGMQKGYEWIGINADQAKTLNKRLKQLSFDDQVKDAMKKARGYGGAAIFKVYDDDFDVAKRVDPANPPPIKNLLVFQRFELFAQWADVNKDILSTGFSTPNVYTFQARNGVAAYVANMVRIHSSRLTLFHGNKLPTRLYQSNGYWHDSVLNRVWDAIRNYAMAHDSVNIALKDLSVAVMKIKDLADKVAAGEDESVTRRLVSVNMQKSIARAVVLDAEGEEFDYKVRQLTGAEKLVEAAENRLSAESNMPRTKLLGEEAGGGLNQKSAGETGLENWYQWLEGYQANVLAPPMIEIAREVCHELKIDAENLGIEWKPLWQMSEKEEVEMRAKQAETDQKYVDMGVVDPTEVRESRFAGDKYTIETKIDKNLKIELRPEETDEPGVGGSPGGTRQQPPAAT